MKTALLSRAVAVALSLAFCLSSLHAQGTAGQIGQPSRLGDLQVIAQPSELTVAPLVLNKQTILPAKGEMTLVLYFDVKNLGAQALSLPDTLKVTVLDAAGRRHESLGVFGDISDTLQGFGAVEELPCGAKAAVFTAVRLPGAAAIAGVQLTGSGNTQLNYDLSQTAPSLKEPYGDPSEQGRTLLSALSATAGESYFTDQFVTAVSGVENVEAVAGVRPGAGESLVAVSFVTKNVGAEAREYTPRPTLTLNTLQSVQACAVCDPAGKALPATIQPNTPLQGNFIFKVPAETQATGLLLQCTQTGLKYTFTDLAAAQVAQQAPAAGGAAAPAARASVTPGPLDSLAGKLKQGAQGALQRGQERLMNRATSKLERKIGDAIDKILPW